MSIEEEVRRYDRSLFSVRRIRAKSACAKEIDTIAALGPVLVTIFIASD